MNEDVDGHATNRAERGQGPDGVLGRKPEDVLAFADDNERLKKRENIFYQ